MNISDWLLTQKGIQFVILPTGGVRRIIDDLHLKSGEVFLHPENRHLPLGLCTILNFDSDLKNVTFEITGDIATRICPINDMLINKEKGTIRINLQIREKRKVA